MQQSISTAHMVVQAVSCAFHWMQQQTLFQLGGLYCGHVCETAFFHAKPVTLSHSSQTVSCTGADLASPRHCLHRREVEQIPSCIVIRGALHTSSLCPNSHARNSFHSHTRNTAVPQQRTSLHLLRTIRLGESEERRCVGRDSHARSVLRSTNQSRLLSSQSPTNVWHSMSMQSWDLQNCYLCCQSSSRHHFCHWTLGHALRGDLLTSASHLQNCADLHPCSYKRTPVQTHKPFLLCPVMSIDFERRSLTHRP